MPDREAFRIGPIPVHWYGIMIMLGVVLASYIAYREARRRGQDPDHVWQLFPWVLIAGILGARVGFVIANLGDERYRDIRNMVAIWEGGLSIQGAVIGGALAVILYCRRHHLRFFQWGDIIAPGLAVGQAIGRWGNFFNQEAFGGKTNLPWGIPISLDRQQAMVATNPGFVPDANAHFHPTFAYEMIWDLVNFVLLMWLGRQKRVKLADGDVFWVYVIVYSIGRFAIEDLRLDSAMVSGFKTPQIIAVVSIIFAWIMIVWNHRPGSNAHLAEVNLPAGYERRRLPKPETFSDRPSRVRKIPSFTGTSKDGTHNTAEASIAPPEGAQETT